MNVKRNIAASTLLSRTVSLGLMTDFLLGDAGIATRLPLMQ
jgi:hypothetical protein